MKDYFYILGVPTTASISEIKAAYRKLSLKFHPDKNDGDKFFEERFKEINEAYETLTDPERCTQYNFQRKGYNSNSNRSNNSDSSQDGKQKQNTESIRNFPTILFFKSNRTEIEKGNSLHISWDTINGETIFIDKIGEVSALGSKEIKINNFNNDGVCIIRLTASKKLGKKESVLKITEKTPDQPDKKSNFNTHETTTTSVPEKNTSDPAPIIAMTIIGIIGLFICIVTLNNSDNTEKSSSNIIADSTSTMSMDTAMTSPTKLEVYDAPDQKSCCAGDCQLVS